MGEDVFYKVDGSRGLIDGEKGNCFDDEIDCTRTQCGPCAKNHSNPGEVAAIRGENGFRDRTDDLNLIVTHLFSEAARVFCYVLHHLIVTLVAGASVRDQTTVARRSRYLTCPPGPGGNQRRTRAPSP